MTAGQSAGPAPGPARLRELLAAGELTAERHVRTVLDAIRADTTGAYVAVAGEGALRAAREADALIRERGAAAWLERPLLGVTVSVKDLLQTGDLPTGRGSLLPNTRPPEDTPAVARLRAAGAVVVGKTATSEYGWSASTVRRVGPPVRNPYDPRRTAGGSSGGAAAAVATGMCDGALGTDGAGSVRIPAAFCGVVGYKPSYGRIPYVPGSIERLSHQGTLARRVEDAAALAAVAAGPHPYDPDSALGSLDPERSSRRLRVGWVEYERTGAGVREVTERALGAFAGRGHRVERIEVRCDGLYPALVDILAAAEAAATGPEDEELCDPGRLEVVRHGRILSGTAVIRAEEVRHALRTKLRSVMDRYDILAMATVPVEPFDAGAIAPEWAADPRDLLWLAWSPATYPFNMTGQPAVSVPAGLTPAGLPAGVQVVGPVGADALVLATAARLETDLGALPAPWAAQPPPAPAALPVVERI
ncbi:amidase family protein [Streptomyces sp. CNZ287]|uniref:amidase family protein n=1 Tax=Streptomyces sp. B22F1 TaxID=3153566 RepID=UPI00119C06EC